MTDHVVTVPLDHAEPGRRDDRGVRPRAVVSPAKRDDDLPLLLPAGRPRRQVPPPVPTPPVARRAARRSSASCCSTSAARAAALAVDAARHRGRSRRRRPGRSTSRASAPTRSSATRSTCGTPCSARPHAGRRSDRATAASSPSRTSPRAPEALPACYVTGGLPRPDRRRRRRVPPHLPAGAAPRTAVRAPLPGGRRRSSDRRRPARDLGTCGCPTATCSPCAAPVSRRRASAWGTASRSCTGCSTRRSPTATLTGHRSSVQVMVAVRLRSTTRCGRCCRRPSTRRGAGATALGGAGGAASGIPEFAADARPAAVHRRDDLPLDVRGDRAHCVRSRRRRTCSPSVTTGHRSSTPTASPATRCRSRPSIYYDDIYVRLELSARDRRRDREPAPVGDERVGARRYT